MKFKLIDEDVEGLKNTIKALWGLFYGCREYFLYQNRYSDILKDLYDLKEELFLCLEKSKKLTAKEKNLRYDTKEKILDSIDLTTLLNLKENTE
jgi:hypothetical protein